MSGEAGDPTIDDWISEFGLDAEIDRLIRLCGYDAVWDSVKSAPARFPSDHDESSGRIINRLPGSTGGRGPGAPNTRTPLFYEIILSLVDAARMKMPAGASDKDACARVYTVLQKTKAQFGGDEGALSLFGLTDLIGLNQNGLYRAFKRAKPTLRSTSDANEVLEKLVRKRARRPRSKKTTVR
jgi:hypothetical protein